MIFFLIAGSSPLTEDEILSAIPPEKLQAIKAIDPKPYFRAFAVMHEGIATPFVGKDRSKMEKTRLRVPRSAVESTRDRAIGAPFYDDYHALENRTEIGREVAQVHKEINGNLHAISVVYGPPGTRDKLAKKDAVSMELDQGQWDTEPEGDGWLLKAIKSIKAFATGILKDGVMPAWAGAVSLGEAYGFDTPPQEKKPMSDPVPTPAMAFRIGADGMPDVQSMPLPVAEHIIKQIVAVKGFLPSQLFSWEQSVGKRSKDADGNTIWEGGDPNFRQALAQHESSLTAPFQAKVKELDGYRGETLKLRTANFRGELMKAALEEAPKNSFDERMTKDLLSRIEDTPVQVPDEVMLLPDEKRGPELEKIKSEYLKGRLERTRQTFADAPKPDGQAPATGEAAPAAAPAAQDRW